LVVVVLPDVVVEDDVAHHFDEYEEKTGESKEYDNLYLQFFVQ
jgi:hypothetical protein